MFGPPRDHGTNGATHAPADDRHPVPVDVGAGGEIVERGLRVGDQPFHRHVFELPLAFPIASEIDAQAGHALVSPGLRGAAEDSFLHRGDLEFVTRAGEAVQQQDDRRLRRAVREVQRADDLLAVDREIHRLLGGEQGRRRKAGCRCRHNQMLDHCDAPCVRVAGNHACSSPVSVEPVAWSMEARGENVRPEVATRREPESLR